MTACPDCPRYVVATSRARCCIDEAHDRDARVRLDELAGQKPKSPMNRRDRRKLASKARRGRK